jgi:hypothetical protein
VEIVEWDRSREHYLVKRPGTAAVSELFVAHEHNLMLSAEDVLLLFNTNDNQEYLKGVIDFAKKIGKWDGPDGLLFNLQYLTKVSRGKLVYLWKDFAPHSFTFFAAGLQGGLIFHGPHDGGGDGSGPTYSVNLTPCDGWRLHT